jgi:hypothetical protein
VQNKIAFLFILNVLEDFRSALVVNYQTLMGSRPDSCWGQLNVSSAFATKYHARFGVTVLQSEIV